VAVDRNGACEAKKPGAVRITAACERARATTKLNVAAAPRVVVAAEDAETQVIEAVRPEPAAAAPPAPVRTEEKRPAWMVPAGIALVVVAAIGGWLAVGRNGSTDFVADTTMPVQLGAATRDSQAAAAAPPVNPVTPPVQEQKGAAPSPVTTPPVQKQPETKQAAGANAGNVTPPRTQTQGQGQAQTQTQTQAQTPPRTDSGTARGAGAPPPVRPDTPVVSRGNTPPPVVNRDTVVVPPPVTPPVEDRPNPLLCSNAGTPTSLLTQALASDPQAAINRLYQGRDAADNRAKDAMLDDVRRLSSLTARVRSAQVNMTATNCDWTVVVEFSGRSSFGSSTRRWQMKVQLEAPSGTPRIRQLFGATRR
jgi:hypothetical protein